KSRGMAHSNQVREFLLTDNGIELRDVYIGPDGVLTGSARLSQEAREKAAILAQHQALENQQRERNRRREALEARIAALRKEFEAEEEEARIAELQDQLRQQVVQEDRAQMLRSRRADLAAADDQPAVRGGRT